MIINLRKLICFVSELPWHGIAMWFWSTESENVRFFAVNLILQRVVYLKAGFRSVWIQWGNKTTQAMLSAQVGFDEFTLRIPTLGLTFSRSCRTAVIYTSKRNVESIPPCLTHWETGNQSEFIGFTATAECICMTVIDQSLQRYCYTELMQFVHQAVSSHCAKCILCIKEGNIHGVSMF